MMEMVMTRMNAKISIFFIAATILITSVFIAQESFANSESTNSKSPSKYEVEILSKEKISETVRGNEGS